MNIHCCMALVVFCKETGDDIDIRGLARLIDKHIHLMFWMIKHAKLHDGQCRVMSNNSCGGHFLCQLVTLKYVHCHTFISCILQCEWEQGHMTCLACCNDPYSTSCSYCTWVLINLRKSLMKHKL